MYTARIMKRASRYKLSKDMVLFISYMKFDIAVVKNDTY